MIPTTLMVGSDSLRIRCDTCRLVSFVFGAAEKTGAEIRRIAAKSGWRFDGKHDTCPSCVRALAEMS
jgi:hypothetical protein